VHHANKFLLMGENVKLLHQMNNYYTTTIFIIKLTSLSQR
jgi:hypothetical protein